MILGLEELLGAPHLGGQATVGEILSLLQSAAEDWTSLREAFAELVPRVRGGELPSTRQLGALLRRHRGKIVSGACLMVRDRSRSGAVWSVERRKSASTCDSGDSGDSAGT